MSKIHSIKIKIKKLNNLLKVRNKIKLIETTFTHLNSKPKLLKTDRTILITDDKKYNETN
jgi:hypothetical protein